MRIQVRDSALYGWFERPAALIALVARMLIGAGLAITLFLKVYMYLLTDWRCTGDATSLGNAIRCMPVLDTIAIALALVVGVGFAAAMFSREAVDLLETLLMALCAAILHYLSELSFGAAGWQAALVLLALFLALAVITVLRRPWPPGSGGSNAHGAK